VAVWFPLSGWVMLPPPKPSPRYSGLYHQEVTAEAATSTSVIKAARTASSILLRICPPYLNLPKPLPLCWPLSGLGKSPPPCPRPNPWPLPGAAKAGPAVITAIDYREGVYSRKLRGQEGIKRAGA